MNSNLRFFRNLHYNEIKEQIIRMLKDNYNHLKYDDNIEISFTGMGEPFLNYENLIKSLNYINYSLSENMINKYVEVRISTVGLVKYIYKLMDEHFNIPIYLQISLHATKDKMRGKLIPYNLLIPSIKDIIEAGKKYAEKKGRKTILKYLLLENINDKIQDAKRLTSLLDENLFCIKLSRLNPICDFNMKSPSINKFKEFQHILQKKGFDTQISISKGVDIEAGCGQLVFKKLI